MLNGHVHGSKDEQPSCRSTKEVQAEGILKIAENDVKTNKKGGACGGQQCKVLANFTGMLGIYVTNEETVKRTQRMRKPDANVNGEIVKRRRNMRKSDVDGSGEAVNRS